jgi:hypothetical protein
VAALDRDVAAAQPSDNAIDEASKAPFVIIEFAFTAS